MIQAESDGPGLGSTCRIALPFAEATIDAKTHPGAAPRRAASRVDLHGLAAMVIEDEPDTRDLLSFILELSGATVLAVESATDAFAALSHSRPHVIISDIAMPGVDGYAFVRKLRQSPNAPPVIALTAYGNPDAPDGMLREGFSVFLPTPVDPTALAEAVSKLARGNERSSAGDERRVATAKNGLTSAFIAPSSSCSSPLVL